MLRGVQETQEEGEVASSRQAGMAGYHSAMPAAAVPAHHHQPHLRRSAAMNSGDLRMAHSAKWERCSFHDSRRLEGSGAGAAPPSLLRLLPPRMLHACARLASGWGQRAPTSSRS